MDGVRRRALVLFLQRARRAIRLPGEVNVMLTSSSQMRTLNRQFRGKDRATDVLSFPSPPALAAQFSGDIAISVDIAARNASRYGHSLMQELKILLLHGMLHLAGYDHEQDDGKMARKENLLRCKLGLSDGLIARNSKSSGRVEATEAPTLKRHAASATARKLRPQSQPVVSSLRRAR